MSPDNHYSSTYVKRLVSASTNLTAAFPHLAKLLLDNSADFRGLTIFLGDTADFVIGVRVFGEDGAPMVLWSSGDDPLVALLNVDKGLARGIFKVDKRAVLPPVPPPPD